MSAEHETATMHVDDAKHDWCPRCFKTTLARSSIYALTASGAFRVGEWAICEECGHSPYAEPPRG